MLRIKDTDLLNGCKNKTPIYRERPTSDLETYAV